MLKRKKTLSKLLATTMVLTSFTVNASAAEVNTSTIGGNDRYETAIKISENGWSSSDRAVLINGEKGLVDALTATPYAYAKNAPILITAQGKLTTSTKNRLSAMNVKNVDIVGGVNSVSNQVVNDLKNMGITVNRISGASRYDTSLAVAKEVDKIQDVSEIAVVNGDKGIPDAVSVAAPAASKKMPILLAENGGLNSASKDFVNGESVSKSYVIGSSNSVSDSVMNSLPGTKTRLGGADRHDTNAAVIKEFYTASSLSNVYVAKSGYVKNNDEIVDALAAGVLAAKNGNPVVLVGNSINSSQQTLLAGKKFTKLTQIGMGVPANAISQIKNTQAEAEASVSSVSVQNYNTLKLSGKNLNLIDKSKISLSGNTVNSYTPNSAGTEATVVFNYGFAANNTIKVTSNLGKVTEHSFTYNSDITSVQGYTKQVGANTMATLELSVNGSDRRSLRELKQSGWDVEFISKLDKFYGVDTPNSDKNYISNTGRLKTNLEAGDTFNYEVVIKKDGRSLKSGLVACEVIDEAATYKSIKSDKLDLNISTNANPSQKINSDVGILVFGESATINDIEVENSLGNIEKVNISNFKVESSDNSKLDIQGSENKLITTGQLGKVTVTVSKGNIKKSFTLEVKPNEEVKLSTAKLSKDSINLIANKSGSIDVTPIDQFNRPWILKDTTELTDKSVKNSSGNEIATIEEVVNSDGTYTTFTITANLNITKSETGKVKIGTKELTVDVNADDSKITNNWTFDFLNNGVKNLDVYSTNLNKYKSDLFLGISGSKTIENKTYSSGYVEKDKIKPLNDVPKVDDFTSGVEYIIAPKNYKDSIQLKDDSKGVKVIAKKSGNPEIAIYTKNTDNTIKENNPIKLTISDSTPKLNSVEFDYVGDIKEAKKVNLMTTLFDVRDYGESPNVRKLMNKVKVTGIANEVELKKVNGKSEYEMYVNNHGVDPVLIGKIVLINTSGANISDDGQITATEGNKGTIAVNIFKEGSNSLYKQEVINVDVK